MNERARVDERMREYGPNDTVANRFEIRIVLGRGGMGVVYAVFDQVTQLPRALKTFRTEHLPYATARTIFLNEMHALLNLGEHPCIVGVRWMEEYDRVPFIVTDLIAPDALGRVTLSDHIRHARGPMPLATILQWGIQFCHAMEFCQAHGIDAHLDVKPDNVLLQQGALVKVADFGIAHAIRATWRATESGEPRPARDREAMAASQTRAAHGGGTPGYISPEVYAGEPGDTRADVFAFGQVLWQMSTGVLHSPFLDPSGNNDAHAVHRRQRAEQLPRRPDANLAPALRPIVERCLHFERTARFPAFADLRAALETALETETGQRLSISIPEIVPAVYWVDKGASLHAVGRDEEAIVCYDRAMLDGPVPEALIDKAVSLLTLDRAAEALRCCDQALGLDARSALAWVTKGCCSRALGDLPAAVDHLRSAIDCDAGFAPAWANLAAVRLDQGRPGDALGAIEQALALDPNFVTARATHARALAELSQLDPAIRAFDRAIEAQPYNPELWGDRAEVLRRKGHIRDAVASVERAITLEPDEWKALIIKGNCLRDMGRDAEALGCFEQALAAAPRFPPALFSKASVLEELGESAAAAEFWSRYLEAAQADPRYHQPDRLQHARKRLERSR